jgi:hypothetical protein
MARSRRPSLVLGIGLLVVGGVLLATRLGTVETAPAWLLGVGAGLALIGILRRSYPALVGGMVLLGIGAGMLLGDRGVANLRAGTWLLLGLGGGFIGVYVLALVLQLRQHWWPLIPGAVLLAVAGARVARDFALLPPNVEIAVRTYWPAALIIVGIFVVVRALRR